MELILATQCVATVKRLHSYLYHQVCEYLRSPVSVQDLNIRLFTRLFKCAESELGSKLDAECLSARVKKVAHQLYEEGFVIEAGSLLLKLQDFHSTIASLNTAVAYSRKLFSS